MATLIKVGLCIHFFCDRKLTDIQGGLFLAARRPYMEPLHRHSVGRIHCLRIMWSTALDGRETLEELQDVA